jgi:hypothetical protein
MIVLIVKGQPLFFVVKNVKEIIWQEKGIIGKNMKKEIKITQTKVINKVVTLSYDESPEGIVCNNSETAIYIWGSSIGITDLKWKLIEKPDNKYLITWDLLKKRKNSLEDRICRSKSALELIGDILNNKGKNGKKNS